MIAGRYTLEREIGRGGAGVVHLGHDEVLGRHVAIKRMGLLPGTTEDDVARAEREARLAAGISHPHVVSILDLVKDEDCYWLVMEHVVGRTLTELVVAEGPLDPARAAGIIAQAADALVEATQAGIVHRDVKPSNIMVDEHDHAKLGDFGIARSANDAALTRTGLVTGSPAYLAPEVASGSNATAASDVWSLGATMYHAVVGRAPYDMGQNVLGGLYRIVHDDPPRLPDGHPLADLLAAMMRKDPGERRPVVQVRDDLRRIARGTDQQDQPPTPHERSDREATVAMGTVATPAASSAAVAPTPTPTATATPVTARTTSTGSPGLPPGRLAAAGVLVVLVGLAAWFWWPEGTERDRTATPAGSGQSQEPQAPDESSAAQEPSAEPTEPEPSSGGESAPSEGDAAAMQAFVQDYFAQVTSDPESTFEMLTPRFQSESGGLGRYSGFWGTIESATVSDVRADPVGLTTDYTIEFVTTSGRTTTEQGRLQLQPSGDGYLIAGEG